MKRRTRIALVLFGVAIAIAVPVMGETLLSSYGASQAPIHHQTDTGLEVVTTKDYDVQSGNPFTATSMNLSTRSNGYIVASSSGSGSVTIDQIQGHWSNASSISAPSNITLNPGDKNEVTIGAGITEMRFRAMGSGTGETGVGDGDLDFIYSAKSQGTIVVTTDAVQGEAYGMVDPDTQQGLDLATAGSAGQITWTEAPAATSQEVLIQQLGTLTIREESEPHNKITSATAEIKFYEDEEDDPTIVEREASNGEIDLTGLPVTEQFVVTVQAPGYHNRTVLLEDLSQQETVFMPARTVSTVENRFVVSDRTGDFPPEDTELVVQRAINRTLYGGSPSGFSWTNIAGDDLGADEAFVVDLEEEERYRILVRNEQGDTRVLGAYTAETTGTINLNIGSVVVDPEAPDTVGWAANRTNSTGDPVKVNFQYNDSTRNTDQLWLRIYEYGNESNVLLSNTSFAGPFGTLNYTHNVPSDENNTEWVVDFTADRGDNATISGKPVVGGSRDILTNMPSWLITIIFVGTIWMTAGVFSQINGSIGGVVVAAMGAVFWFLGVAPPYLGGGVVALSLITGSALFVRDRRGGGL